MATAPRPLPAALPDPWIAGVLDAVPVAVAVYGADGRLAAANAACLALWHQDAAWAATRPSLGEVLDRLRAQRRLPEVADFRTFRAEQLALFVASALPAPELAVLPDGTLIQISVRRLSDGGLAFVYEDMTERRALRASLKEEERTRAATIEALSEGIAVFGSDGRLRLSNPALARLWNLDAARLDGGFHVRDLVEAMRPFAAEAGVADWPRFCDALTGRILSRRRGAGRLVRADGSQLDYATVPLPDGAVLLTYLDVSASTRIEQALRAEAEALAEASRLKSGFIANVSHEVRTPLTSILGFAQILSDRTFGPLNPRQADYARAILDAAGRLMTVIGDILDLAAIEAGSLALESDAIDVHAMLVATLNLVRERARHRDIHLEFDVPPEVGWVHGDEKRLKQVLFHLLSNALAFTPSRGGVRLSAAREDDMLALTVADTGVGIPLADQDRVLRPFEKGARPKRPDLAAGETGAGLGLTLVRKLVELHGGSVTLKSVPNRGTAVTVRLPAGGAAARDAFQI